MVYIMVVNIQNYNYQIYVDIGRIFLREGDDFFSLLPLRSSKRLSYFQWASPTIDMLIIFTSRAGGLLSLLSY